MVAAIDQNDLEAFVAEGVLNSLPGSWLEIRRIPDDIWSFIPRRFYDESQLSYRWRVVLPDGSSQVHEGPYEYREEIQRLVRLGATSYWLSVRSDEKSSEPQRTRNGRVIAEFDKNGFHGRTGERYIIDDYVDNSAKVAAVSDDVTRVLKLVSPGFEWETDDGEQRVRSSSPQASTKNKKTRAVAYSETCVFIIEVLRAHHLDDEGKVSNPDPLGVRQCFRHVKRKHIKVTCYQVEKFFKEQFNFTNKSRLKGWGLYSTLFAGPGNESRLLKWFRTLNHTASETVINADLESIDRRKQEPVSDV